MDKVGCDKTHGTRTEREIACLLVKRNVSENKKEEKRKEGQTKEIKR